MQKLVVRVPNSIGDCVMALPALQLLQQQGIDLRIVGRGWCPSLLRSLGVEIAELPTGQRAGSHLLQRYRHDGFQHLTLMTHSCSSAAMAKRAGLSALGFAKDWRGPLLTKRLPWPRETHEVRRYWQLAEQSLNWLGGCLPGTHCRRLGSPWCRLAPSPEHIAAAEAACQEAGLPDIAQTTLICPVATGTVKGMDKQWPHFQAFAQLWQADADCAQQPLAVVAPPGKEQELQQQFPNLPLLKQLSMDAFLGVLSQVKFVIANDSGPMHVACAMGTKCLVPFGTGITFPERTGAWSPNLIPLTGGQPWPSAVQALETIHAQTAAPQDTCE